MSEQLSAEQIQEYWARQAGSHGQSPAASWSDVRVIELEIAEITVRLEDGDRVLDAGCANGFSTVHFASSRKVEILGVDYIPAMIENARERLSGLSDRPAGKAEFSVGDVRRLDLPDNHFDKVISTRVIINLGAWVEQERGLRECVRVLRPGGLLLLSEATLQGWQRLNALRLEWGLTAIPMPAFNNYLDEEVVTRSLAADMDLLEIKSFAGTYYVGSRVLKPLLARACGLDINLADPLMELNRWFAQLPQAGDYSTQKLFVFQKR